MKKLIILLIFILGILIHHARSQDVFIGLSFTPAAGFAKSKSFGKFTDSYNTIFENQLKNKLNKSFFVSGYTIGAEYLSLMHLGVNYTHLSGKSTSLFNEGVRRIFELNQNIWSFPVGFGKYEESGGFVSGSVEFGLINTVMKTYARYADGTISMGNERILNGSYKSFHTLFTPVIQAGYSSGPFVIALNLAYNINALSFGNLDFFNMDRDRLNSIPEDYAAYLANTNFGIVYDEVKFHFNGFKIGLSIKFNLVSN